MSGSKEKPNAYNCRGQKVRERWNVKMVRVALIACHLPPPVLDITGQKKFSHSRKQKIVRRRRSSSPCLTTFSPFGLDLTMANFKLWQFFLSPLVTVKEVSPARGWSSSFRWLFIYLARDDGSRIRLGQGTTSRQGIRKSSGLAATSASSTLGIHRERYFVGEATESRETAVL